MSRLLHRQRCGTSILSLRRAEQQRTNISRRGKLLTISADAAFFPSRNMRDIKMDTNPESIPEDFP